MTSDPRMSYATAILPGMTQQLPSRWEGVEKRVPERLEDLHGPADGRLALPLHLAWSGMREFDLSTYRHRLSAYHIVVVEAMRRQDAEEYLNADHLVEAWPDLRRLIHPRLRQAWESSLPQLTSGLAHSTKQ